MKEGEKEAITFFYGKTATLRWDPDRWRWVEGCRFLNYTTKSGRDLITKRTEGVNLPRTNGKATYLGITNSIGL